MLTIDQAREVVLTYLQSDNIPGGAMITSIDNFPNCWVFDYTSAQHFQTGDVNFALGGNCPLLVEKESGLIYQTGIRDTLADFQQFPKNREQFLCVGPSLACPWVKIGTGINITDAKQLVLTFLNSLSIWRDSVLIDEKTLEYDVGWIFYHTTHRFLQTGKPRDSQFPNDGPVLVDRNDGYIYAARRAEPLVCSIDSFRRDKRSLTCLSSS
jgi:hypothetical protein